MHDLIVALLKFAINVNVLDVETSQMLENFVVGPRLDILPHTITVIKSSSFEL